jgi:hypothetical protein
MISRGLLASGQRRSGKDAANDHAGIEVPGLGLQTDLDDDLVFACALKKRGQLVEGFD